MIPIMMYLFEDDIKAWHSFSNITSLNDGYCSNSSYCKISTCKAVKQDFDIITWCTHFEYFSKCSIASHGKISARMMQIFVWYLDTGHIAMIAIIYFLVMQVWPNHSISDSNHINISNSNHIIISDSRYGLIIASVIATISTSVIATISLSVIAGMA